MIGSPASIRHYTISLVSRFFFFFLYDLTMSNVTRDCKVTIGSRDACSAGVGSHLGSHKLTAYRNDEGATSRPKEGGFLVLDQALPSYPAHRAYSVFPVPCSAEPHQRLCHFVSVIAAEDFILTAEHHHVVAP